MFKAVLASFKDVFARPNRKIFYQTIFLTIILYALSVAGISFLLLQIKLLGIAWLDTAIDALGIFLALVIGLFLLPAIVSLFSELFADKVIDNTEKHLFTKPPKANPVPFIDSLFTTLGFSLKSGFFVLGMCTAYLLTLPFLLVPILGLMLGLITSFSFYLLNAFIIGRGYFDTVAMRYLKDEDRLALWYNYRLQFLAAGFIIAFLFSIPFVNLVAPLYSFAIMTRFFWIYHNKDKAKN